MPDVAQVLAEAPMPAYLPAGAEERKRRNRIAEALIMQGSDTSPVQHWTQGAARVAQSLAGSLDAYQLDRDERRGADRLQKLLMANPALGGGGASPAAATSPAAAADPAGVTMPTVGAGVAPGDAISSIESGGRYDALGPVIPKTGDQAYGKYQVMGANIPEWTRTHVGREMTPQEFLASPDAQDAVFKGQFGGYEKKYGKEGASRAWFAGEGGMNDLARKDPLGTSVADYSKKFQTASLGPVGPVPAAAAPGVPESVAAAAQPSTPSMAAAPAAAAPAAAVPSVGATGQPARMQTAMDPQMRGYVQLLLASRDPGAVAMAQSIMAQYSKPTELKPVTVGDRAYTFNPATGAYTNPIDAGKPKFAKFDEATVLDESTGQVRPVSAAGFKPLTDPAERLAHGIPETDKRPYQLGPGNKLVNPPAETRINIDQKAEGAFENKAGELQATRFNDLVKGAYDAKAMIADLNYLRDIGSRIGTGKEAEVKAAIGPYSEAIGVKIDGLSDLQAYNAVVSRLQPRMRVPGSGATSDYEMKTFLAALPSIGKTPEGNAIISNTLEALQQQHLAAGEIASRVMQGELKRAEGEKMLRELPDPFELWKKNKGVAASAPVPPPGGFQVVQ